MEEQSTNESVATTEEAAPATEAIAGALPGMLDASMPELPEVTGPAVPSMPSMP